MFKATIHTKESTTFRVNFNDRRRVMVRADGEGLVGQAGSRLLAELAERSGLEAELSRALAPLAKRVRHHAPVPVLVDLAVILAAGGECISDLAVLPQQPELFGEVASTPTARPVLDSIGPGPWTPHPHRRAGLASWSSGHLLVDRSIIPTRCPRKSWTRGGTYTVTE